MFDGVSRRYDLTNTVLSGELTLGTLQSDSGDIIIDNTGGLHTDAPISTSGAVSLTAHSPITINDTITAHDIALSASTSVSVAANATLTAVNAITVSAGTSVTLNVMN